MTINNINRHNILKKNGINGLLPTTPYRRRKTTLYFSMKIKVCVIYLLYIESVLEKSPFIPFMIAGDFIVTF